MAQAARDYSHYGSYRNSYRSTRETRSYRDYYSSAAPQRREQPARAPRPNIHVVPGKGRDTKLKQGLSAIAVSSFKLVVALAVVFAAVLCVRVGLSVATVQSMANASELSTQIEDARDASTDLEIQHSVLTNPTNIQKKASDLGMAAPKETTYLTVTLPVTVVENADGSLSMSQTIERIVDAAAAAK